MIALSPIQYLLGALSGSAVGLSLGLFGGGGSILAVPLLVYLVGLSDPHVAIGTSAVAVAANALSNLVVHARRGNVAWRCALIYSAAGVVGAALGSIVGKALDGQHLLLLFSLLMFAIAALMFLSRNRQEKAAVACTLENAPKTLAFGAGTGAVAGFFGIGGGFLIVPGLVAATGMSLLSAVGSSLVAVSAFGLTTAVSYGASGLVDWPLAAVFVACGAVGGRLVALAAGHLARRRGALNTAFTALIVIVATYMSIRAIGAF
ncbi:MAG: sulfite exporter TauE/SafE family protein [Devosia sp.]|nr:sulfite exporter TauE/SafE family protein [Devosia sp.]